MRKNNKNNFNKFLHFISRQNPILMVFLLDFIAILVNSLIRNWFETGPVNSNVKETCWEITHSWESCATEDHPSAIIDGINFIDTSASLLMMAGPAMIESFSIRLSWLWTQNQNMELLKGTNVSLISLALAREIKAHINSKCISGTAAGSCLVNIDFEAISHRPEYAKNLSALMGKKPSIGFPSGHAYTLFNRAIEHYFIIEDATKNGGKKSLSMHYFMMFVLLYAAFTRYSLQWHTLEQIIYSGGFSAISMLCHRVVMNTLKNMGVSEAKLIQISNYFGHFILINSFGPMSLDKMLDDAIQGNFLKNAHLFYSSMVGLNILIDASFTMFGRRNSQNQAIKQFTLENSNSDIPRL